MLYNAFLGFLGVGFWPCMGLALLGLGFNWELEIRVGVRVLGSVVKKVAMAL